MYKESIHIYIYKESIHINESTLRKMCVHIYIYIYIQRIYTYRRICRDPLLKSYSTVQYHIYIYTYTYI